MWYLKNFLQLKVWTLQLIKITFSWFRYYCKRTMIQHLDYIFLHLQFFFRFFFIFRFLFIDKRLIRPLIGIFGWSAEDWRCSCRQVRVRSRASPCWGCGKKTWRHFSVTLFRCWISTRMCHPRPLEAEEL